MFSLFPSSLIGEELAVPAVRTDATRAASLLDLHYIPSKLMAEAVDSRFNFPLPITAQFLPTLPENCPNRPKHFHTVTWYMAVESVVPLR
jgi:hypothetical protein